MIDKYAKLQKWAEKVIHDHGIAVNQKDKYKMIEQLALYFDALIFNVVSIICLITVINNSSKISQNSLDVAKRYIESKCHFNYAMTGGRMGSATFLGAHEPMYSVNNPTNDIMNVNFADGIARPQIGGRSADKTYKIFSMYINSILAYHDVKASKEIKKQIYDIIKYHIHCLLNTLKQQNKTLSLRTLNKIVKNNKILHPHN